MQFNYRFLFLVVFTFIVGLTTNAQIFGPNRDWVSATRYTNTLEQDSLFIFFDTNPPLLRAQFSDSSASTYAWYKYDPNYNVTSGLSKMERFRPVANPTDSLVGNASPGGYMVEVKRIADDSLETYIGWLMVDNIIIESLHVVNNSCENLQLIVITNPVSAYDVNAQFTYYDISREAHQELSALSSGGYFATNSFQSLNTEVVVQAQVHPSVLPFIFIEYENPKSGKFYGPLYDAAYLFSVTTPFGRGTEEAQTEEISAVATQADFDIKFWAEDNGDFGSPVTDAIPSGEALLRMKLESKSVNVDSLYWNILNDKLRFAQGGDSIVWSYRSLFPESSAEPDSKKMIPGFYGVEHIASKTTANLRCRDTLLRTVDVDTSFIRDIPNVFTPSGSAPYFKISEDNLRSIKSFKIVIVNRTGQQVYRYVGDPKQWEGWNGKIDGTKGDAPAGVYYFVIDAVGWDGTRYRNGQYKGFVHLYR